MEHIIKAIKANKKRMEKLYSLTMIERREKARAYVVAECAAQKVQLTNDQIAIAAVRLCS